MKKKILKKIKNSSTRPCEICKTPNFLIEHHINGRGIEDSEHPSNKCLVCSNCHTDIHMGKVIIEKWIYTTEGSVLKWHLKGGESFTGEVSRPHLIPS